MTDTIARGQIWRNTLTGCIVEIVEAEQDYIYSQVLMVVDKESSKWREPKRATSVRTARGRFEKIYLLREEKP